MAARGLVFCFNVAAKGSAQCACRAATRTALASSSQRHFHCSPTKHNTEAKVPQSIPKSDPIAESMKGSTTPTGSNIMFTEDYKNAAYLGEADSDDGFEASVETHPEHYRHKFSDVSASGLHGQAGEGDQPIERKRKLEALDATQSAYLGEADSDDAHESDREINPEKYRHQISDAQHAAYLGEADSDDAHETDRDLNPEKYRHRIDDARSSGMHGESGEGDEPFERKRR